MYTISMYLNVLAHHSPTSIDVPLQKNTPGMQNNAGKALHQPSFDAIATQWHWKFQWRRLGCDVGGT